MCILYAMRKLKVRNEGANLSVAGISGEVEGKRTIDVRVADSEHYLPYGPRALATLEKVKRAKPEETLDFSITFRYSHQKAGRRLFLYSDRFLTRFLIIEGMFQLQVFHSKGIGRVSPVEVAALIESHVIRIMRKKNMEPRIEILQEQS